ncbi:hypothetical protein L2D08_20405 [Domibacillus sp. PGB-M46]|uniref:hypothetical protein n=1 Tax=Domibacillus sp. PGB-M46 TaxID=2910255 RepID=UPI001F5A2AC1|nr:hypothetical protein [Domibacillus sp. PGB-M46]MCI2256698.1 hypothetical protein [Domibacillus sp. PGB-M46]
MKNRDKKDLFLKSGVRTMALMFIKDPFWRLTFSWPNAYYSSTNPKNTMIPPELKEKGLQLTKKLPDYFEIL